MASTNYINECKNRVNHNRLGKIIVNGINTPITNSDNLQKIEINSGCYIDGSIIGSVYIKKLNGEFIALNENLTDKTIEAQIGVKYANNSTEYIKMGKYIVEKPKTEITANMKQITAYSIISDKLENKYVCNINYEQGNKTLKDLYIDVCNQLGLTPATTTFDNSNIPITANPFTNGESNKTVLQTVAKIACTWVEINDDTNKIELCWLSTNNNPDYTFEKSDYSEVEGGDVTLGPINCVVIKNSQIDDENYTKQEGAGDKKIVISEDYILYNESLRIQAMTAIWAKLHNLTYTNVKLTTYYGKPFLKIGSKIRVMTGENTYIDTYVLMHTFTYDGTFTSIIESPVLTDQEIKTKQTTIFDNLKNTQVIVDKQNQQIQALITNVEESNEKIDALQPTEEATGIEELYLPNSAGKDLIEYRLKGKSEQKTTTGKNLFIQGDTITNNGVTYTKNDDGSYNINGTASPQANYYIETPINETKLISGQTYTLSCNKTFPNSMTVIVETYNGNTWLRNLIRLNSGQTSSTATIDLTNATRVRQTIRVYDGREIAIDNLQIMLEKGNQVTSYEQYTNGASPNPDYPQDVKSIGDVHNLFIKETITEGKSIASSTGGTYNDVNSFCTDFIDISNISQLYVNGSSRASDGRLWGAQYDNNKNYVAELNSSNHILNNFNSNTKYIRLGILNTYLDSLMISENNIDYLPHGNYIDVVNRGKNLFDNIYGQTKNVYTKHIDANSPLGSIDCYPINLLPNTQYTLKIDMNGYQKTGAWIAGMCFANGDVISLLQLNTMADITTATFTTDSTGVVYVGHRYGFTSGETGRMNLFLETAKIQLEEGNATPYEPYTTIHNYINLTQPLPSLPDGTADELIVKDGKAKIIQNVGRVVLDGTESGWGLKTSNPRRFDITTINLNITNIKDNSTLLETQNLRANSHFRWNVGGLGNVWGLYYLYGGYLVINDANSTMSTLNDFKSWLSNNNVLLQYALAEPVEIDLGEVSIKTIDGNDYLYITNPIKAEMYAKYIRNTDYNDVYYTKTETESRINVSKESITSEVSRTYETKSDASSKLSSANNYADKVSSDAKDDAINRANKHSDGALEKVVNEITPTMQKISIIEGTIKDGVPSVKTETGFTFDKDGLKIAKEGQEMNSLLDNDGLSVKRNTDEVLTVRSEGVNAENITVRNYFKIDPIRFEKISSTTDPTENGLGIFYTGGDN